VLGSIAKLAGKYFRKGGTIREVAADVAIQSGISGLMGTIAAGPGAGLAYGLGDFATNLPLVALSRKYFKGPKGTIEVKNAENKMVSKPYTAPSRVEQGVNLGASMLSPLAVDMVTGGRLLPQIEPTNVSQAQQLYQQGVQFQELNHGATQALAQGTRFQVQGLPDRVTNMPVPGIALSAPQQEYLSNQMKYLQV
jgi:hypothetical protein